MSKSLHLNNQLLIGYDDGGGGCFERVEIEK
jgi:hypothetical protein